MDEKKDVARVLVVDDDPCGRHILTDWLKRHYNVIVDRVHNGKTAVEFVSENHYDLVFMDIMMPIMDGITATAAIRALEGEYFKNLPVFGISPFTNEDVKLAMAKSGMTGWFEKPFNFYELEMRISKYLK
jgi:CheY-like chemotaxis protein